MIHDLYKLFLYSDDNFKQVGIYKKNNIFLGGFMENDRLLLAFVEWPERYTYSGVNIYDVQKGFDKPAKYIAIPPKSQSKPVDKLLTVQYTSDNYCVISTQETFFGVEAFTRYLCGGYAIGYAKPYFAKIEKNQMSLYKEINYGGEKYEDFEIRQIIYGTKLIHCLGKRHPKYVSQGVLPPDSSVVLYYAGYNPEERRIMQNGNIYKTISDPNSYDFGTVSLNVMKDKAFVAFTLHKHPYSGLLDGNIKQTSSDIYFFESDQPANTIKISEGFLPNVKFDSKGNVHVLATDSDGRLFIIRKDKDNKWTDKQFILKDVKISSDFLFKDKYIDAEFDKDGNLHVVYPANDGNIVYVKMKLD
ncbi:MAG: hypothetical protein JW956_03235 [Calditrichaceae bacterium]|nr:hypothetical protein [Calditrichaceae bacterium]